MNLTDIHKTFHSRAAEDKFFLSVHEIVYSTYMYIYIYVYTHTHHMLGHGASLNKLRRSKSYQVFFLTT